MNPRGAFGLASILWVGGVAVAYGWESRTFFAAKAAALLTALGL